MELKNRKIAIAGLGLIGGSLAKAFRKYCGCGVAGFDRDPAVLKAALACGAVTRAGTGRDLRGADLLCLCLYPGAAADFVEKHLGDIRPGCVVTDTCGVKAAVCRRLAPLAERGGFVFVGGHPMAGTEKRGFAASDADLFRGASCVLTPCGAPQSAVDLLKAAAGALGFGRVVLTTPEEHDRRIAFTSQLPHALACAYVMSPQCPRHAGFSGGSYRDVSRVANLNEALWAELFLENRGALVQELDRLTQNLTRIRNAVAAQDAETLRALLRRGRKIKEELRE
jgi:prephenate dehydrogenase